MDDYEDLIREVLLAGWHTDGYGMDSMLICAEHGETLEIDGACCYGCISPLRSLGLI